VLRKNNTKRTVRGFSLIELLIVMAMMLILAAMVTPITLNTMDAYKLRGSMGSVSGLAQRCRLLALQKNTTSRMYFQTNSGAVTMYCKANNDPTQTLKQSDPQLTLDTKFSIGATPSSTMTSTTMWGAAGTAFSSNSDPYFNSRGLPCAPPSPGAACSSIHGYVYYFKYSSRSTRWTAVSVSPASRMQNWFLSGSSWGN
jgi:prepilin-type N-terminal cleavage/methylation domain-containing protein